MSSILKIKDKSGNWIDIPAIIGLSAYEVAVKHGYDGTEEEWLESLKGKTPHIGVNGNWYIGEYDTGIKADVSEALESLEQTMQNHDKFINSEMPHYLEDVAKLNEKIEGFPKIGKVFYDAINDKEFIKSSIAYVEGNTSQKTYVAVYENRTEDGTATFSNAPCKSGLLFHYQTMSNVIIQTLYGSNGRVYQRVFFADMGTFGAWSSSDNEEVLTELDDRVTLLEEEVEEHEKSTLPRIYYDTINNKDFIKSSINYAEGATSKHTYVGIYENQTEDGTATFSNAPCKSGLLFHYQTMSNVIIQTLYGSNGRVYQRVFFADMGTFGAWSDTWETVETLEEDLSTLADEVGNISTALDELHTYAQALIGGEE